MFQFSEITVTMEGLLSVLYAVVAVMIIVVLYHLLFIVTDLRKIMRRMEDTTAQVEALILKPLAILDEAFAWVMDHVSHGKKGNKPSKKGGKAFDIEEI